MKRRDFFKLSASLGAGLLLPWKEMAGTAFASPPLTLPPALLRARSLAQGTQLPGSAIPQFIDPLPLLSVAGGPIETIIAGIDEIELDMHEFQANVMPSTFVPADGQAYTGTWVWGYRAGITPDDPAGTYIGPVLVTTRHQPTQIRFVNNLTANHIAWREWTDQTLHWADPLNPLPGYPDYVGGQNECMMSTKPGKLPTGYCADHYGGSIPAVPHLHGGEQPPVIDGGPEHWFTADGSHVGNAFHSLGWNGVTPQNYCVYRYPNVQEAAPLWFHDHLLGGTRLNVYAGLAGAYVLTDPNLALPTGLHAVGLQQGESGPVDYLIPLVLQDRMFDTNGQLYFPNMGINPEHPFWIPEFVGDTIVINGKVWPFLNVEPRRYRFLLINGSNARTYELFIANPVSKAMGPPIWQIVTDGGYLDTPVKIDPNVKPLDKLRIMPGERAGFIVDFAGYAGQTLLVRNTGRTPYPKGESPHGSTLGQILQIRVGATSSYTPDESYDPASGIPLRPSLIRLVDPVKGAPAMGVSPSVRRQLTLNEIAHDEPTTIGGVTYEGGPLEILVNNTKWNGTQDGVPRSDFTQLGPNYLSELPNEGATELWEIVNLTADAHPIHTHLTQFQLMNRQNFNMNKYEPVYEAAFPWGGDFIPAYGPPKSYDHYAPILGGNPDVTPYLQGPVRPPDANEAGWKDTVVVPPGMVTRFIVRFAPFDTPIGGSNTYAFNPYSAISPYVWHCHIVDHEDNEMMRPYAVMAKGGASRTYVQGTDY
jgi:spore coat protein A